MTLPMTSPTTPAPYVVTATPEYAAGFAGWYALDMLTTRGWFASTGVFPYLLTIDLGTDEPDPLAPYELTKSEYFTGLYTHNTWQLQSSPDGINWTTEDTQTNVTNWTAVRNAYTIATPKTARFWRLRITATNTDPTLLALQQILLISA